MTHPQNSYHYQPATDFETQEHEHMYQQSHPIHMPISYEGNQRGLQQGASATGHSRRNNSLTAAQAPSHSNTNGNSGMIYYYDWKNFPMTQAPGSFIPSPEEANIHGQGPAPAPAIGAMSPYHPFASANSQFMPPQPPASSTGAGGPPSLSSPASAYSSMAVDPALAAPSMNSSNFMPGPSPNFNNSSMSYNFIPGLPPPFAEQYFSNPHRTSAQSDMRNNGNSMGEGFSSYPAMYQQPASASHFANGMHISRLASPPSSVPSYASSIDSDYYAPPMPFHHPMMMNHAMSLHFQSASRSASPSLAYSTSPSPSAFHYSHGPAPSSPAFACHPFSRPSLPPSNSSMNNAGSGPRLACRPCIRGHRAPSCKHTDRPLFAIRPRGRPSSQCIHCKEARKTGGIHVKCLCGNASPSSKSNTAAYGSLSPTDMHKVGGMVAAEPVSKFDSVYGATSPMQQLHGSNNSISKAAANKSALAAVMQSFWSGIHTSEHAAQNQELDSASESVPCEPTIHRRTLTVEATDTVSQKPPEGRHSVDFELSNKAPDSTSMQSKCICNLGMPCLCSSKSEKLPRHAEPASITSSLHSQHESDPIQQRVLHPIQPMDHNSYEYHRLNALSGPTAAAAASANAQQESDEQRQESEEDQEGHDSHKGDDDEMLSREIDS